MDGETEDELETSFHKFVRFQEFEKRRSTPKKKINQKLNQSDTEHYTDISDYASETGKVTKGRGRVKSPAGAARPWDLGIQTDPLQTAFMQPTFMQPLVDAAINELNKLGLSCAKLRSS